AVAKKFADLGNFEKAMHVTQVAQELKNSKNCLRGRNHDDDVHPFSVMREHMLQHKQYRLAEECARKQTTVYRIRDRSFSEIILQQFKHENYINEQLISEMDHESLHYIKTYEGLAIGLIEQ